MSLTIVLKPHENPRIDVLTTAERLRWVLEFIQRDLEAMPMEELASYGDDLIHATAPWWVGAKWPDGKTRECTDMPAAEVLVLQEEIRAGIQAVTGQSIDIRELTMITSGRAPPVGWALPVSATYLVPVRFDRHGDYVRILGMNESTNDRTAILTGVANLISTCGSRLCTCPVCGTPFLRQYRQAYCTVKCSNKVRNRRRLDRQIQERRNRVTRAKELSGDTSVARA